MSHHWQSAGGTLNKDDVRNQPAPDAVRQAMLDDLGLHRIEELPMEDGERRPRRAPTSHGHHPVSQLPSRKPTALPSRDPLAAKVTSAWHVAIDNGVFRDIDWEEAQKLDPLGGARSYVKEPDVYAQGRDRTLQALNQGRRPNPLTPRTNGLQNNHPHHQQNGMVGRQQDRPVKHKQSRQPSHTAQQQRVPATLKRRAPAMNGHWGSKPLLEVQTAALMESQSAAPSSGIRTLRAAPRRRANPSDASPPRLAALHQEPKNMVLKLKVSYYMPPKFRCSNLAVVYLTSGSQPSECKFLVYFNGQEQVSWPILRLVSAHPCQQHAVFGLRLVFSSTSRDPQPHYMEFEMSTDRETFIRTIRDLQGSSCSTLTPKGSLKETSESLPPGTKEARSRQSSLGSESTAKPNGTAVVGEDAGASTIVEASKEAPLVDLMDHTEKSPLGSASQPSELDSLAGLQSYYDFRQKVEQSLDKISRLSSRGEEYLEGAAEGIVIFLTTEHPDLEETVIRRTVQNVLLGRRNSNSRNIAATPAGGNTQVTDNTPPSPTKRQYSVNELLSMRHMASEPPACLGEIKIPLREQTPRRHEGTPQPRGPEGFKTQLEKAANALAWAMQAEASFQMPETQLDVTTSSKSPQTDTSDVKDDNASSQSTSQVGPSQTSTTAVDPASLTIAPRRQPGVGLKASLWAQPLVETQNVTNAPTKNTSTYIADLAQLQPVASAPSPQKSAPSAVSPMPERDTRLHNNEKPSVSIRPVVDKVELCNEMAELSIREREAAKLLIAAQPSTGTQAASIGKENVPPSHKQLAASDTVKIVSQGKAPEAEHTLPNTLAPGKSLSITASQQTSGTTTPSSAKAPRLKGLGASRHAY